MVNTFRKFENLNNSAAPLVKSACSRFLLLQSYMYLFQYYQLRELTLTNC